ncbi:MAG TPA: exodeoxyribonuclease VII small subunit [Acidimicrobiales bacterium]|jgi:exodeoxyribonuclease VII small subunit|nr:exodeoxyribonuclease VII small subunit [Acidimicrobiales bacterium]
MTDEPTEREQHADHVPYAAAVAELDRILAALERDDLDVDAVAGQVRRAADLIAICRARIDAASYEVQRVVADLDEEG